MIVLQSIIPRSQWANTVVGSFSSSSTQTAFESASGADSASRFVFSVSTTWTNEFARSERLSNSDFFSSVMSTVADGVDAATTVRAVGRTVSTASGRQQGLNFASNAWVQQEYSESYETYFFSETVTRPTSSGNSRWEETIISSSSSYSSSFSYVTQTLSGDSAGSGFTDSTDDSFEEGTATTLSGPTVVFGSETALSATTVTASTAYTRTITASNTSNAFFTTTVATSRETTVFTSSEFAEISFTTFPVTLAGLQERLFSGSGGVGFITDAYSEVSQVPATSDSAAFETYRLETTGVSRSQTTVSTGTSGIVGTTTDATGGTGTYTLSYHTTSSISSAFTQFGGWATYTRLLRVTATASVSYLGGGSEAAAGVSTITLPSFVAETLMSSRHPYSSTTYSSNGTVTAPAVVTSPQSGAFQSFYGSSAASERGERGSVYVLETLVDVWTRVVPFVFPTRTETIFPNGVSASQISRVNSTLESVVALGNVGLGMDAAGGATVEAGNGALVTYIGGLLFTQVAGSVGTPFTTSSDFPQQTALLGPAIAANSISVYNVRRSQVGGVGQRWSKSVPLLTYTRNPQ